MREDEKTTEGEGELINHLWRRVVTVVDDEVNVPVL